MAIEARELVQEQRLLEVVGAPQGQNNQRRRTLGAGLRYADEPEDTSRLISLENNVFGEASFGNTQDLPDHVLNKASKPSLPNHLSHHEQSLSNPPSEIPGTKKENPQKSPERTIIFGTDLRTRMVHDPNTRQEFLDHLNNGGTEEEFIRMMAAEQMESVQPRVSKGPSPSWEYLRLPKKPLNEEKGTLVNEPTKPTEKNQEKAVPAHRITNWFKHGRDTKAPSVFDLQGEQRPLKDAKKTNNQLTDPNLLESIKMSRRQVNKAIPTFISLLSTGIGAAAYPVVKEIIHTYDSPLSQHETVAEEQPKEPKTIPGDLGMVGFEERIDPGLAILPPGQTMQYDLIMLNPKTQEETRTPLMRVKDGKTSIINDTIAKANPLDGQYYILRCYPESATIRLSFGPVDQNGELAETASKNLKPDYKELTLSSLYNGHVYVENPPGSLQSPLQDMLSQEAEAFSAYPAGTILLRQENWKSTSGEGFDVIPQTGVVTGIADLQLKDALQRDLLISQVFTHSFYDHIATKNMSITERSAEAINAFQRLHRLVYIGAFTHGGLSADEAKEFYPYISEDNHKSDFLDALSILGNLVSPEPMTENQKIEYIKQREDSSLLFGDIISAIRVRPTDVIKYTDYSKEPYDPQDILTTLCNSAANVFLKASDSKDTIFQLIPEARSLMRNGLIPEPSHSDSLSK